MVEIILRLVDITFLLVKIASRMVEVTFLLVEIIYRMVKVVYLLVEMAFRLVIVAFLLVEITFLLFFATFQQVATTFFIKFNQNNTIPMLHYNIERAILMRGHINPKAYLKRMGFTRFIVSNLLSKPQNIRMEHIEKLCLELHCTPNDLMELEPSESKPMEENHPLKKLIRTDSMQPMREAILRLPPEKLSEAIAYMNELSEQK